MKNKTLVYIKGEIEEGLSITWRRLAETVEPTLGTALEYSLFPGGKRIRPLLSNSLLYDLCPERWSERFLRATLSLEFLHLSSLIHDDLPALDNDDLRRGRASLHKAFDESTAILAGDFLISWAYQVVACSGLSSEVSLSLTEIISSAFMQLCDGQQRDLRQERGQGSFDRREINTLKTGALFRASAEFAAAAGELKESEKKILSDFGLSFGLLFQAVDDVVDSGDRPALGEVLGLAAACEEKLHSLAPKNKPQNQSFPCTKELISLVMNQITADFQPISSRP